MIIPTRSEVKPTDKTLRDKLPSTHQEAIIDHPLTNESAAPLVIPTIRIGMDEQSVERLLGSPRARRRGSDILQRLSAQFGIMGITEGEPGLLASQTERDFAIYDHPEGQYNVVYLNGKVVEVHRQPFP
jgi:hypothetical protein